MDYSDKHKILLAEQEQQPPHLTIRQMGEALGVESTSHIIYMLEALVAEGLAEKVQVGKKHIYRMLKPSYKHNEGKES